MKQRYSIRFPGLLDQSSRPRGLYRFCREEDGSLPDPDLASAALDAPPQLAEEMADLVRFKTATLTAFGYQRNGVWGEETASQKIEHLGLMFGALAASPSVAVHGFGVPLTSVAFKNANSFFFGSKPFRLILPDLSGLYHYLEAYIDRHRRVLLKHAADPGTLFVKTVRQLH